MTSHIITFVLCYGQIVECIGWLRYGHVRVNYQDLRDQNYHRFQREQDKHSLCDSIHQPELSYIVGRGLLKTESRRIPYKNNYSPYFMNNLMRAKDLKKQYRMLTLLAWDIKPLFHLEF